MEGFGGSDTAREAEDGKRGGGRKLPATCLKWTQLPALKDRKKPGKTRPSAEIVECEIGKFGGHENRRRIRGKRFLAHPEASVFWLIRLILLSRVAIETQVDLHYELMISSLGKISERRDRLIFCGARAENPDFSQVAVV